MKRKIILHGYLKDLYPKSIEVEADTIAEALRSLENIPELIREDGSPHVVDVDGVTSDIALYSKSTLDEIHVRPRLTGGGGRGGLFQILIGIVLIAVAIVFPVILGFSTSSLFLTGAMMVLGGILQMLLPTPTMDNTNQETSKYLGADGNTVRIGTRIPLIYGTRKAGGHYLSFDVDAVASGTGPTETSAELVNVNDWNPYQDIPAFATSVGGAGAVYIGGGSPEVSGTFYQHDVTPSARHLAPVRPVYASPITSPTNLPIDFWSPLR